MKGFLFFMGILILSSFISATCNNGQIDINTASLEELDEIKWVGPSTAQNIVDARPFSSVDELIEVAYIGESRLSDIKSQGLACVENSEDKDEEDEKDIEEVKEKTIETVIEERTEVSVTSEVIKLGSENEEFESANPVVNPKDIKMGEGNFISEEIAIYGLVGFCILIGFLFMIRKLKKYDNEFDE